MLLVVFNVEATGFEPVTSALSRRRSKPTELRPDFDLQNYNIFYIFIKFVLFLLNTKILMIV